MRPLQMLVCMLLIDCSADTIDIDGGDAPGTGDDRQSGDFHDVDPGDGPAGDPNAPGDPTSGDPGTCPVAVIAPIASQAEVLTTVQLDGSGSSSPRGTINTYSWTLTSPSESSAAIGPGPTPTLLLDVPGTFQIELTVSDDSGRSSCESDTASITAEADGAFLRLLWSTPGDPDPTDAVGSDLALHLHHPSAVGRDIDGDGPTDGWFDATFDCNQTNPTPDWGIGGTTNDPAMAQVDSDGTGPEILRHAVPEAGTYAIGVHYRDDAGFGSSSATVHIWVSGVLVAAAENVTLAPLDFWQVADITWPSGAVSLRTDDIVPNVAP